jgi:hypothetical protein
MPGLSTHANRRWLCRRAASSLSEEPDNLLAAWHRHSWCSVLQRQPRQHGIFRILLAVALAPANGVLLWLLSDTDRFRSGSKAAWNAVFPSGDRWQVISYYWRTWRERVR